MYSICVQMSIYIFNASYLLTNHVHPITWYWLFLTASELYFELHTSYCCCRLASKEQLIFEKLFNYIIQL